MEDSILTSYGLSLVVAILFFWAIGATLVNKAWLKAGNWRVRWFPLFIGWDPFDVHGTAGRRIGRLDLWVVGFSVSYGWDQG